MLKDVPALTIRGKVRGEAVVLNTREICRIDRHNLDEEIARQAELHAYVTGLAEGAKGEALRLAAEIEELDANYACKLIADGGAAEYRVKWAVRANPARRSLVQRHLEADQLARDIMAVSYALMHRNEQLTNLSGARGGLLARNTPAELERAKKILMNKGTV